MAGSQEPRENPRGHRGEFASSTQEGPRPRTDSKPSHSEFAAKQPCRSKKEVCRKQQCVNSNAIHYITDYLGLI